MRTRRMLGLLLTGCALLLVSQAGRADLPLLENGKAVCTIVLSAQATEKEKLAAGELQTYLKKMSGAEIPIATDAQEVGGTRILIGGNKFSAALPLDVKGLGRDGYLIQVVGSDLVLEGATTDEGTLNAVYGFLEGLGVRWYMPGELGEEVPLKERISTPGGTVASTPDFRGRFMFGGEWGRRNRQGGESVPGLHSFFYLVPAKDYYRDHPDYYSLVEGKRIPISYEDGQLCTTNPEVAEVVAEKAIAWFDANPTGVFSIAADDNTDFCECDSCRALDVSPPDATDRLVEFYNRVAEIVAEKHPERKLAFLAYISYTRPPLKQRPHKNLTPMICRWVDFEQYGQGILADNEKSRQLKHVFEEWNRLSETVATYEYYGHYMWLSFFPMVNALGSDLRFYRDVGVDVVYSDTAPQWGTQGLNLYVAAKLLWDVDQDVNALVDDYCRGMFHAASQPMARFYRLLEMKAPDLPCGHHILNFPNFFTREFLSELRKAIEEARGLAKGDQRASARVALVDTGLTFTEHYAAAARSLREFFRTKDRKLLGRGLQEAGEAMRIAADSEGTGAFPTGAMLNRLARLADGLSRPLESYRPGDFDYTERFRDWGARVALQARDYGGMEPYADGMRMKKGEKAWLEYEFTLDAGGYPGISFQDFQVKLWGAAPNLTASVSFDGGLTYQPLAVRRKTVYDADTYFQPGAYIDLGERAKGQTRVRLRLAAEDSGGTPTFFLRRLNVSGKVGEPQY